MKAGTGFLLTAVSSSTHHNARLTAGTQRMCGAKAEQEAPRLIQQCGVIWPLMSLGLYMFVCVHMSATETGVGMGA